MNTETVDQPENSVSSKPLKQRNLGLLLIMLFVSLGIVVSGISLWKVAYQRGREVAKNQGLAGINSYSAENDYVKPTPFMYANPTGERVWQTLEISDNRKLIAYSWDREEKDNTDTTHTYSIRLDDPQSSKVEISSFIHPEYGDSYGLRKYVYNVGDMVYILNALNNTVDVYKIKTEPNTPIPEFPSFTRKNSFIFQKSLVLPRKKIGHVYDLDCKEMECTVTTAVHIEGVCTLTLNLETGETANLACRQGASESQAFEPRPL